MKNIKTKEKIVEAVPVTDVATQVQQARKELFQLRLTHAQGKLKETTLITMKRKEIARMLTEMRRKELENNGKNA